MSTPDALRLAQDLDAYHMRAEHKLTPEERKALVMHLATLRAQKTVQALQDCPHAAPHRYCDTCAVSPCPIGLGPNVGGNRLAPTQEQR